jgi:hypothetical protein
MSLGIPINDQMLGMDHRKWRNRPKKPLFSTKIDASRKIYRANLFQTRTISHLNMCSSCCRICPSFIFAQCTHINSFPNTPLFTVVYKKWPMHKIYPSPIDRSHHNSSNISEISSENSVCIYLFCSVICQKEKISVGP